MQTDPTASAPRFLGKYEVLARLDSGGMAEIFLARARGVAGFEKLFVIKRILPHLAAEEEFVSLFLDEAKTTVALSHGNVVQVFDMGKDAAGDYFIAMEYVAGKNLRRLQKRVQEKTGAPLDPSLAAWIVSKVLEGLDYAHRRTDGTGRPLGIVHRDVSPHNILISYEGEVKLTDFGIAKAAGKVSHTEAGFVRGKASYMSPEQAMAAPLDGRSDLYSAGVVLWELLTGDALHPTENPDKAVELLRAGPPPPAPSSRREGLPPALDAIVARALARDPADRYPSADALRKDIGTWLAETGVVLGPRDLAALVQDTFAAEIEDERRQIAALPKAATPPLDGAGTPATAAVRTLDFEHSGEFPVTGVAPAGDVARARRARLGFGAGAAALLLLPAAAWMAGAFASAPDPTPTPTPVVAASPSPSATASPASSPPSSPPPSPRRTRIALASPVPSPLRAMAKLSITTKPWGVITIDGTPLVVKGGGTTTTIAGRLRTTTPIQDLPIKPGHHVVRVEQLDPRTGEVLQRGEMAIDLAPGESRLLSVPMKPLR